MVFSPLGSPKGLNMNSLGISSGAIHIEPLRGFDGEFYCEFGFFLLLEAQRA